MPTVFTREQRIAKSAFASIAVPPLDAFEVVPVETMMSNHAASTASLTAPISARDKRSLAGGGHIAQQFIGHDDQRTRLYRLQDHVCQLDRRQRDRIALADHAPVTGATVMPTRVLTGNAHEPLSPSRR